MTHSYFRSDDCDLTEFATLVEQQSQPSATPLATDIQKNVPIYDMSVLRGHLSQRSSRKHLMAEWANVLMSGSGVLVFKQAYADTKVLDDATQIYQQIIASEKAENGGAGDHFAASGANDRIWNSAQKLCLAAPDVFLHYFANTSIAAISEAWLGPNYQMTAQINLVRPGGAAQQAHRDYHLGFQTAEISEDYPAHVHDLSPALTLQGGVAHCDMPIESGPTKLLPFSQLYRAGYAAWRREDFRSYFDEHHIQLPLSKGDAVFFNPALFHAAGANGSADIHRMVNLLQISSAFGRAMETLDRRAMCEALYPHALIADKLTEAELFAAIAACAEGYSFPTNLDRDPPVGGLAPETHAALFRRGLSEGMTARDFNANLAMMVEKQKA